MTFALYAKRGAVLQADILDKEIVIYIFTYITFSEKTSRWLVDKGTCYACKRKLSELGFFCKCHDICKVSIPIELHDEFDKYYLFETKHFRNAIRRINREEKIKNADGYYKKEDIEAIYNLQGGKCYYCKCDLTDRAGVRYFEVEHLFALDSGGSQWPSNLSLACKQCNQKKGVTDEDEYWSFLRKSIGIKAVRLSRKQNESHIAFKEILTKKRKAELLNQEK